MGFLRKLTIISTGGLAPIKTESYKERTAKATEKQVRLQEQATRTTATRQRTAHTFRISCAHCDQKVRLPMGHDMRCPKCSGVMDVCRVGGVPGIRPVRAMLPAAPALDSRGRVISKER